MKTNWVVEDLSNGDVAGDTIVFAADKCPAADQQP